MNIDYRILNDKLDVFLSIGGIAIGLLFSLLYLISPTIYLLNIGVSLLFASFVYLFAINKCEYVQFTEPKTMSLIYEILFFLCFSISMYILYLVGNYRHYLYFIAISSCVALLALSIFVAKTKRDEIFQILKIFLISFNLKYSIYFTYTGFSMADSWRHAKMNDLLSQVGNMDLLFNNYLLNPSLDKEYFFPIMHFQVTINQILLGTDIKHASNTALIIPLVISSVCVFLFAKKYFGNKIGLLAMLIINISDYHILWGSAPQTTSYGICLYFFLLLCVFKIVDFVRPQWILILLILILCLILSHAVSSFIFLITLLGLLCGNIIYNAIFGKNAVLISPTIVIITLIGILQHWMVALYRKNGTPFFDKMISSLHYYIIGGYAGFLNRPESVVEYANTLPPFFERFVDHLGFTLLLFFSIFGCLFWFSKRYRSNLNFSLIICLCLLLGITLGFPFFGLVNIIPGRWFVFEYFFLSIMASFGFVRFSKLIISQKHLRIFIFLIFFSLSFFMSSSTISNSDSPLWLKESTISESFTLQEVQAGERLANYSTNTMSDSTYYFYFSNFWQKTQYPQFTTGEIDTNNINDTMYIWRKYTLYRPVRVKRDLQGEYNILYTKMIYEDKILGFSFFRSLESYNKIYDNHDVSAYSLNGICSNRFEEIYRTPRRS